MTTIKPPESEPPESSGAISADTDLWIRQFVKQFELHVLDASRDLPPDASVSESQEATARAILATYLDSGMDFESVVELLGQVAVERRSVDVAWSDALNQRRFALIDKEIQGSLTPAESIELAGLTRIMRDHVDSEANLPMEGARALHRKLLQLEVDGRIRLIFDYPEPQEQRRHGPANYAAYESYRPWLRDEFDFRCVYCLKRETWGQVTFEFELDHFEPQSLNPQTLS